MTSIGCLRRNYCLNDSYDLCRLINAQQFRDKYEYGNMPKLYLCVFLSSYEGQFLKKSKTTVRKVHSLREDYWSYCEDVKKLCPPSK